MRTTLFRIVGEALYLKGYYNTDKDCMYPVAVGEALDLKGYYNLITRYTRFLTVGEALDLKGYYNPNEPT